MFQFKSFRCTLLNGFKYRNGLNISILPIDGTLSGTTTVKYTDAGKYETLTTLRCSGTKCLFTSWL